MRATLFTSTCYSTCYRRTASPSENWHGGGGNRTRVRKPSALRCYVCSPRFSFEPEAATDGILKLGPGKSRYLEPRRPRQPARILTVLPRPTGRDREDRALKAV